MFSFRSVLPDTSHDVICTGHEQMTSSKRNPGWGKRIGMRKEGSREVGHLRSIRFIHDSRNMRNQRCCSTRPESGRELSGPSHRETPLKAATELCVSASQRSRTLCASSSGPARSQAVTQRFMFSFSQSIKVGLHHGILAFQIEIDKRVHCVGGIRPN